MEETTIIESLIGVPIPDYIIWVALGAIIVVAIILVAWGFFKEVKKK